MKKIILLFVVSLFINSFHLSAQIKLLNVNEQSNTITIKNFGNSTVNVSDWWLCALFSYAKLSTLTVENGSLQLDANATVSVSGFGFSADASDMGLYQTNTFINPASMRDFTQWGAPGQGREGVAVAAGLWTAGDFLSIPGPFEYTGDGSQSGIGFWNNVLSVNDFGISSSILIYPNPVRGGLMTIKNQSNFAIETIQIYNVLGVLVLEKNSTVSNNYDLNSLKSGQYIAKIQLSENKIVVKKIMVL